MAADPRPRDDQPAATAEPQDLIGRWLAHHEQRDDVAPAEQPVAADPPAPAPGKRAARRLPAAAVPSAALAGDPVLGASLRSPVATPRSGGGRRRAADDAVDDLERRAPADWEPVLLGSVRKRAAQVEEKAAAAPAERPGRRARLKARLVEPPAEPPVEPPVEAEPAPEPEPPAVAPPEPVVVAPPEPVVVAPPEPVVVAPPEAVVLAEPEPEPVVLAEPEPAPPPRPEPVPEVTTRTPTKSKTRTKAEEKAKEKAVEERVSQELPSVYVFKRRRGVCRVLSLVLLAGLAGSAYTVRQAAEATERFTVAIAAITVAVTLLVWAIRAGASPTTLTVRGGQLEVVRQGARHVFDLQSTYTRLEVRGRPGRRGWQVVFPRQGAAPFVVDASLVDPKDFTRVLHHYRPDLAERDHRDQTGSRASRASR